MAALVEGGADGVTEGTATQSDTKSIFEFLAENPNVDVSKAWERCYGILKGVKERIAERLGPVELHPACADREYYTSPDESWEGSFQAWQGAGDDPKVEWLVNSWLGARKNSILDMNATAWLGQQTDVPHLVIVFGTVPNLFFYADYIPRADLLVDEAYVDKYYGDDVNKHFLELRGDKAFTRSVSHGSYLRGMMSPAAQSLAGDLTDENVDKLEAFVKVFVDRWFGWLDEAEKNPVPEERRAAQMKYDHTVRRLGYERDPMNALASRVFGPENVQTMIDLRMGREQMAASEEKA